jgi:hypothetical protein
VRLQTSGCLSAGECPSLTTLCSSPSFSSPQTCRALNQVISHSARLRYKLELSKHGMCDGTSSFLGTADKLNLLAAHVTAWRNLPLAKPQKLGLLEGWSAPRAVSGNILIFSRDGNHLDSSAHPPSQSLRYEHTQEHTSPKPGLDLLVLRLPSTPRQVEASQWVLGLPEDAGELCIDASQDLLIYVLYVIFVGPFILA